MKRFIHNKILIASLLLVSTYILQSCKNSEKEVTEQEEIIQAEILTLHSTEAVIDQTYPTNLEGKDNIQLRPQISGYIDKIYVDEGAYVQAGQPLFRINASVYREQKILL